jgi:predicted MFS family arabinose efflux permease
LAIRLPITSAVLALGIAQTLAWASSYYLLAVLADPIAKDTGMTVPAVFAAFSCALLIAALLGPRIGRTIDRFGGRSLLVASNIFFAAGLGLMSIASSSLMIWASWAFMGAGMGLGLYDAAFATLGCIYGIKARAPITGITLMAGFASTVGWPLTAAGLSMIGWRETCLAWMIAHLLIGLPLNASLPQPDKQLARAPAREKPHIAVDRNMWLLAFAFAAGWTISTAMAAHLPRLLQACGSTEGQAIAAGMLIGPAQVAARAIEAGLLRRVHPLLSARLSSALHPLGAAFLMLGAPAVPLFALLHGAGNGILTIARGTVPLAIYGPENYGYRLGILGAPSRVAQAAAPLLFGLLIEAYGAKALVFSAGLGFCTLAAFWFVRPAEPSRRCGNPAAPE